MEFFLGQTVSLFQAGNGRSSGPSEHSERTLALARTLDQLRDQVDKGLLAIGIVKDEFERRNPETKMSAKGMGIFLSSLGFNKTSKKADMCGLRQVFGLHFDEKVERFIRVQLNR
jgi:hypothetical protein